METKSTTPATFLNDENIESLKIMFGSKEDFIKNMQTLNVLHGFAIGEVPANKHVMFKFAKLTEDLISALNQNGFEFDIYAGVTEKTK